MRRRTKLACGAFLLLFACAVAAEYVGTIFERLNAHIIMARTEAERGQEMWAGLIERLPVPALLIDPDTLRIVTSSEHASIYLRAGELPLEGRPLFEAFKSGREPTEGFGNWTERVGFEALRETVVTEKTA